MSRQIISIGIAGIIIGFILGFFSARFLAPPPSAEIPQAEESLPGNHPGVDVMEKVHSLTLQAEENPGDIDVRVELGNTFYDMGRYDVSTRWYSEALSLNPDQVMVSTDFGTALLFMGRTEEAIAQYRHSLSIQPGHAQSLQNLGVAFFSLEQYQDALDIWKQLLESNPDYSEANKIREQITAAEEKITSLKGDSR